MNLARVTGSARVSVQVKSLTHLLDVNALIALLDESHVHHSAVTKWFDTPGLQWALCPFTEAGVLRFFMHPKMGDMTMAEASLMLAELKREPGYHYLPIVSDWQTLTKPFFKRLHGYRQVTDAYLLGLAMREGFVLVSFDKALSHLAGEHSQHVLILE